MPSRSVRAEKNNHNHNLLNHYNHQHTAGEGGGLSGQQEGEAGGPRGGGGGGLCALDIMVDHLEMTARTNLLSKTDSNNGAGGDGLRLMMIDRNGGERSTEVSVPLVVSPAPRDLLHNQNNNHGGGGLKRTLSPGGGDNLYRLRDRKFLLEDKKRLCASALGTALLGILLMVLHQEMCPCVYTPGSVWAFIINCSISLSTLCLLLLILAFHYKDVQVFVIDHNQVDWRIAMTSHRLLGICVELLVCAIHPVGTYWELGTAPAVPNQRSSSAEDSSSNNTTTSSSSLWPRAPAPLLCVSPGRGRAPLDAELLLSLLMFLRLYLVHRAILLHSKVLLSASYRSIGSLNNINFTFRFVLKVLMNNYPARTLTAFILAFWLTTSWMLTLCERQTSELTSTRNMDVALWLIAITFLTVGYGDVSPQTSCGKTVCLFTGVMGVACTAMLVAVVTKKLALNKGEKHVHFFMLDIQVSKRIRHAAANVLRECWLLHRTNVTRGNGGEHRTHQRRLVEAIRVFRHLRLKQRKLRDYASEMVDLPKMQMIMCDLSTNWNTSYRELEQRIVSMEHKLDELGRCFQQSTELLAAALRLRSAQDIR